MILYQPDKEGVALAPLPGRWKTRAVGAGGHDHHIASAVPGLNHLLGPGRSNSGRVGEPPVPRESDSPPIGAASGSFSPLGGRDAASKAAQAGPTRTVDSVTPHRRHRHLPRPRLPFLRPHPDEHPTDHGAAQGPPHRHLERSPNRGDPTEPERAPIGDGRPVKRTGAPTSARFSAGPWAPRNRPARRCPASGRPRCRIGRREWRAHRWGIPVRAAAGPLSRQGPEQARAGPGCARRSSPTSRRRGEPGGVRAARPWWRRRAPDRSRPRSGQAKARSPGASGASEARGSRERERAEASSGGCTRRCVSTRARLAAPADGRHRPGPESDQLDLACRSSITVRTRILCLRSPVAP